jgi:hypothetical protein
MLRIRQYPDIPWLQGTGHAPSGRLNVVILTSTVELFDDRFLISVFAAASHFSDQPLSAYPNSSIERGQSFLSNRDRERSARIRPSVWQRAQ